MNKSITIDGNDFSKYASFDFITTHQRSDDFVESTKIIEKVKFTGDAYKYLNDLYFVAPYDIEHVCKVVISDNTCDFDYNMRLRYIDCKVLGCGITATPESEDATLYDNLKKNFWYGNGFDNNQQNFRVGFCSGFTFINAVLVLLYIPLVIIVGLLNVIDDVIDIGDVPTLDDLNNVITGCGKYQMGYSAKEMFEYQSNVAGMQFQSSILQKEPYDNSIFVPAQNNEGFDDDQSINFDAQNAIPYSVLQMAAIFAPVYNAIAWIQQGIFRLESILDYEAVTDILVDLEAEGIELEYGYSAAKNYAYGSFKYNTDALDQDGNQSSDLYSDTVEWNIPPKEWQNGSYDLVLKDFSPCRFQHDKNSDSIVGGLVDDLRKTLKGCDDKLELSNSRSEQFKLLIWDGVSGREDVHIKRRWLHDDIYEYNYDYFFDEKADNPELYQRFHYINSPLLYTFIEGDDFTFTPCDFCETVGLLNKTGCRIGIKGKFGVGLSSKIEADHDNKTIKVSKPIWRIKRT